MPEVLYHFSEDPSLARFEPRITPTSATQEELVWAVAPERAYLYYFPRDCPRVSFYAGPQTNAADRERFLGLSTASQICAIEAEWLARLRETRLYRYEFASEGFELMDECAGYWTSRQPVEPLRMEPVGDLLAAHAAASTELRIMPSLWPLYEAVIASTLQFSIIRWRNAAPRPAGEALASAEEVP
jgi:hypothetical protein